MALTPNNYVLDGTIVTTQNTETIAPSKTWKIDFEKGTIGKSIDGEDSLRQFIRKAVMTERNKYVIYSDAYGNELFDLIGEDITIGLMDSEIPRMVRETLIYDDRIEDVIVEYSREGDKLFINVTAIPVNGAFEIVEEVELNV